MPRLIAVALLLACALLPAGCGGKSRTAGSPPGLPTQLARDLASRSGAVARRLDANDPCGAAAEARGLQAATRAAINAHRVPGALQEELSSAVNDLADRIFCVEPQQTPGNGSLRPGKSKKHGKAKGHFKKGGGGEEKD